LRQLRCDFTTFHNISQHFTTFHNISQHFATLCCDCAAILKNTENLRTDSAATALRFHNISQHFTTFHNISQHFTTFRNIVLRLCCD
jgi:hypothetical protein